MKRLLVLCGLALSLPIASGEARECKSDVPQAEAMLARVRHLIETKDIARIEVFWIPYHMESPVSVYPELIEHPYNLHPNSDFSEKNLNDLALAIGKADIKGGIYLPDLKWSLKIYDKTGEFVAIRIGPPYIGNQPRRGLVNEICVTLDNNIPDWLEANFKPFKKCFETARTRLELQKCSERHGTR